MRSWILLGGKIVGYSGKALFERHVSSAGLCRGAAHLEPEILLVDEVLAVGDDRFQKKCLNKMQDVGKQGPHRSLWSQIIPTNMRCHTRLCERLFCLMEAPYWQTVRQHKL